MNPLSSEKEAGTQFTVRIIQILRSGLPREGVVLLEDSSDPFLHIGQRTVQDSEGWETETFFTESQEDLGITDIVIHDDPCVLDGCDQEQESMSVGCG